MLQNISEAVLISCPTLQRYNVYVYGGQNIKPGQCLRHFKRPDGIRQPVIGTPDRV